jgi:branched-chain amino acid transport system permease protein
MKEHVAISSRSKLVRCLPVVLLLILALVPLFGLGPNAIRLLFVTLVWMTVSVSWNLLGGFGGQVSFGFAVFYGLGAYAMALSLNRGINAFFSLLLAGSVALLASLLVGLPTFRLKGPYFAIATIGVSEAVRVVMTNLSLTGGASGYRILEAGSFHQLQHFYAALALASGAIASSILVRRSKFGLGLIALREDEEAASDLGVNPFRTKLLTHALAAALAGAAGGVYARYAAFIHPQGVFAFSLGVAILLMPIIGGVGTIWGPVIGAVIYGLVHEELIASFPQLHLLLYGSLLILIILFEPGGVIGLLEKSSQVYARVRRANAAYP